MNRPDELIDEQMPLVSIITPSYQQGAYIRETIESVLSQDYPHVEHIVMDGGSTDDTVNILKKVAQKYGSRFRFVSEKDKGQSDALNKGIAMAHGTIIGWLNSDDTYLPKAISRAVAALTKHSEYGMVYGNANHTDQHNKVLRPYPVEAGVDRKRLFDVCTICQPAVFIRKSVLEKVGAIDESLQFCMDYELWMRISAQHKLGHVDRVMANSRLHDECKSVTQYFTVGLPEIIRSSLKHYGKVSNHWLIQYIAHYLPEGPVWIMEQLKKYGAFGHGPRIDQSNRFVDGWVPPRWTFTVSNEGEEQAKCLIIHGEHLLPRMPGGKRGDLHLTVRVDGHTERNMKLGDGSFTLNIPLDGNSSEYKIDIQAGCSFVPANLNMNDDRRLLSYKVIAAAALTPFETKLYNVLDDDPASAGHWLIKHNK